MPLWPLPPPRPLAVHPNQARLHLLHLRPLRPWLLYTTRLPWPPPKPRGARVPRAVNAPAPLAYSTMSLLGGNVQIVPISNHPAILPLPPIQFLRLAWAWDHDHQEFSLATLPLCSFLLSFFTLTSFVSNAYQYRWHWPYATRLSPDWRAAAALGRESRRCMAHVLLWRPDNCLFWCSCLWHSQKYALDT